MKKILLFVGLIMMNLIQAQSFTEADIAVMPLFFASADFADFDNDGDQDLAVFGVDDDFNDRTKIYRNDEGVFTVLMVALSPMHMGALNWVDYDSDGDYDLFCSGQDYSMNAYAVIYENSDGEFSPSSVELPVGFWNSAGWGDFDNDGDLDLAYSWYASSNAHSAIFKNGDGVFTDIDADLPGMTAGSMEWGDFDNDGDLDLLFTGTLTDFSQTPVKIFKNEEGNFVEYQVDFMDCAWYNNALWSDIDGDGDLDIVYVGDDGNQYPFVIYLNLGGSFDLLYTGHNGVRTSNGNIAVVSGDIDNDGDMDFVMTGDDENYDKSTKILINNNGVFSNLEHNLPGFGSGTLDLTDIDNDGDLDIFMIGYDQNNDADVGLFMNDANSNAYSINNAPDAPNGLTSVVDGNTVSLSWEVATDDHTPSQSIQYNICVGTAPGSADILCAQSVTDANSDHFGFHFVPKQGNCEMNLQHVIPFIPDGIYFWSVQAIDQSGMASVFADEQSFQLGDATHLTDLGSRVNIYPNPASEFITLNYQGALRLFVYNLNGQQVISQELHENISQINVGELSSGHYIVKLISKNGVEYIDLDIVK